MSPIDIESMSDKLTRLDTVILELEDVGKTPRDLFLHDRRLQAATERYFILGIEIITDIGNHLLLETTNRAGTSYEDIIGQLGKQRIVPSALSKRNIGMAKFRNLLVHFYEVTDPERVYEYLQTAPNEFRAFAKAFAKHLD